MHFYRDEKGRVWLQEYSAEKRRSIKLSRDKSRHLDALSDEEVEKTLKAAVEPEADELFKGLPIRKQFEQWKVFLAARGYDRQTVRQHKYSIERFVFKFFAEAVKRPDAKDWPPYSIRFYNWMCSEGNDGKPATASQIKQANIAFKKFYGWLIEEGHVPPASLKFRNAVSEVKAAVLPRPVVPDEVLKWAQKCDKPHVKVMGLVGYFFSLRPQEIFALVRSDFKPGDAVVKLECCRTMKAANLFDRLAVYINKQQQNAGTIVNSAKKGSNGWVACFNLEAARMIVGALKSLSETESVVGGWNNAKLYNDWHRYGLPDLALKDLRRGSLYYLGHYSNLQPMQLMKHARHRNIETTMLYCRRPDEQLDNINSFDLGV